MSYNKVIMMGRLTRDPELRATQNSQVCEIGIAVDSGWGEHKRTCFVDVTIWGKQAEFVNEHFQKGDGIHIDGRLEFDTWDDKNGGGRRTKHRVTAERVCFPIVTNKASEAPTAPTSEPENLKEKSPTNWNAKEEIDEIPF